jgi:hypothetical protein
MYFSSDDFNSAEIQQLVRAGVKNFHEDKQLPSLLLVSSSANAAGMFMLVLRVSAGISCVPCKSP